MSDLLDDLLNDTQVANTSNENQVQDFMSTLPAEQQVKAKEISSKINTKDIQSVIGYGANVQEKLLNFSNQLAEEVHKSDTSGVKQVLSQLMTKIGQFDLSEVTGKGKGLFSKFLPAKSPSQKLISKYQKMGVEVDYISTRLEKEGQLLVKEIDMLDKMYDMNKDYYTAISVYIAAGKHKIHEIETTELPALQLQATPTNPLAMEEVQDLQRYVHMLEKRVHDLHLSQQISLQKAPQIRMIQENHRMLVEKIQSSVLNTIPLWKDQFILGLTLERQSQAIEMQKKVTDTTNELLLKNSELLKTNSVEIAKENERGIVDLETLQQTMSNLLGTIDEVMKIQETGREKRQLAEQELLKMDQQLKEALVKRMK